jgi:hypothetical protein
MFFFFWDRKAFEIRNKSALFFEFRILFFNERRILLQKHYVDSHLEQFSSVNRRVERFNSEDQDMKVYKFVW